MSEIMSCPHCNGQVTITPDLQGIDVTCPHCQQVMSIPGAPQSPAPAPTPYGGQQYQQPGYGPPPSRDYQQQAVHVPDYLVLSILVTLFCCLIGGIVGIVYSANARGKKNAGDYRGALKDANAAKTWCIVSIVISVVITGIFLAVGAMQH